MASQPGQGPAAPGTHTVARPVRGGTTRHADETKPAYKTTEFIAYVTVLAGVFIAGLAIKGAEDKTDEFVAPTVWLFATILTVGYMLSRGIAKSGSHHRDDDRH